MNSARVTVPTYQAVVVRFAPRARVVRPRYSAAVQPGVFSPQILLLVAPGEYLRLDSAGARLKLSSAVSFDNSFDPSFS